MFKIIHRRKSAYLKSDIICYVERSFIINIL